MRGLKIIAALLVALVLVLGSFTGGLAVGWFLPERAGRTASVQVEPVEEVLPVPVEPTATPLDPPTETPLPEPTLEQPTEQPAPDALNTLFGPFWEAWEIVHAQFIDQPVDDVALMRGAIRGMLAALGDQHTSYMDPDEYTQANIDLGSEYEGIGAWVDTTGELLIIITPMPGSPAEEAGLRAGDVILAVDGEDMTGIDGNLVIRRIMGPAGTDVVLTVLREGEAEPFDVTVTRGTIVLADVESEMLDGNVAYVRLNTFGDDSTAQLRTALEDLLSQEPVGLILDLRNNGGGYLSTAIEISSEFIAEGQVVMYEEFADGEVTGYEALPGGLALDIPLVVLVNEGSASASEILAGAIQDLERGPLVGQTTFGKGSVQNWVELSNGEGAVRVTIARWLTAAKRQIHEVGLEPDYAVEFTEADVEAGTDPQLEKAVELLTNPAE